MNAPKAWGRRGVSGGVKARIFGGIAEYGWEIKKGADRGPFVFGGDR